MMILKKCKRMSLGFIIPVSCLYGGEGEEAFKIPRKVGFSSQLLESHIFEIQKREGSQGPQERKEERSYGIPFLLLEEEAQKGDEKAMIGVVMGLFPPKNWDFYREKGVKRLTLRERALYWIERLTEKAEAGSLVAQEGLVSIFSFPLFEDSEKAIHYRKMAATQEGRKGDKEG